MHSLVEGFKNITRSFWLSLTAISVLFVSLASVSIILILSTVVGASLEEFNKQLSITFYLDSKLESATIIDAQKDIQDFDMVDKVKYVSILEHRKEIESKPAFDKTLKYLDKNGRETGLLPTFEIIPANINQYEKVVEHLKSGNFDQLMGNKNDSVVSNIDVVQKLQKVYWWINLIGIILIVVFSLISILVISNILRVSIYTAKEEIEIMRLVGGTNGYIQGPFVFQALFYAFVASIILAIATIPALEYISQILKDMVEKDKLDLNVGTITSQIYMELGAVVLAGFLVSYVISHFSTKKYMKM